MPPFSCHTLLRSEARIDCNWRKIYEGVDGLAVRRSWRLLLICSLWYSVSFGLDIFIFSREFVTEILKLFMCGNHVWFDWQTLTNWLTCELTDCLNDWLTYWLTDWLSVWLTNWSNGWLTDWLNDLKTDWLTDWMTDWLTEWLTEWLNNWKTDWPP